MVYKMNDLSNSGKIIFFSLLDGVGRKRILKNLEKILSVSTFRDVKFVIEEMNLNRLCGSIDDLLLYSVYNKTVKILSDCSFKDINIINYTDNNYPCEFKEIDDPPVLFFVKGQFGYLSNFKKAAVIGRRDPSLCGYNKSVIIGEKLATKGFAVISGLAKGCDTGGHKGCISKKGYTVAILPGGINNIYPPENRELSEEIIKSGGCLISEYLPDLKIDKYRFIERDRLQAALSGAVYVIESSVNDGTMHTIGFAEKYKKPVYCLDYLDKGVELIKRQGNKMLLEQKRAGLIIL